MSDTDGGRKGAAAIDGYLSDASELSVIIARFHETRGRVLAVAAEALAARLGAGGKVLAFGNGGSAAEAQHFAAELVNGLGRRDRRPLPAIALTADTSTLTAIGNDRGFDRVFARQIEAMGRPGDVALALTTSGTSPNVIEALKTARAEGLMTIVLTGEKSGAAAPLADFLLDAPSCSTARIQEAHLFILHHLARCLEEAAGRP
jgi:D-sedoheptulose 7-phosphate isomerase